MSDAELSPIVSELLLRAEYLGSIRDIRIIRDWAVKAGAAIPGIDRAQVFEAQLPPDEVKIDEKTLVLFYDRQLDEIVLKFKVDGVVRTRRLRQEGGGTSDITLSDLAYTVPGGRLEHIAEAKSAFDHLFQGEFKVNLHGGGTFEVGQQLTQVELTWEANKPIDSQFIDGIGSILPEARSYSFQSAITSDKSYKLTAFSGTESSSDTIRFRFKQRRFWGTSPLEYLSVSADVYGELESELADDGGQTRILSPAGTYMYFAFPKEWGDMHFTFNNMNLDAWDVRDMRLTNEYGYTQDYQIYRSWYKQNGTNIELIVTQIN